MWRWLCGFTTRDGVTAPAVALESSGRRGHNDPQEVIGFRLSSCSLARGKMLPAEFQPISRFCQSVNYRTVDF